MSYTSIASIFHGTYHLFGLNKPSDILSVLFLIFLRANKNKIKKIINAFVKNNKNR